MKLKSGFLATSVIVISSTVLHAADASWSSATGNWSDTTKWTGGAAASGPTSTATFGTDISATAVITQDVPSLQIANITFSDNGATGSAWTLSGATSISLGDGTTVATSTITTTTPATISTVLTGANSLAKAGAATLTLSGANTYTGGTILNGGGSLAVGNATALGTGPVSVNADSVLSYSTSFANNIALNNANLSVSGNFTDINGAISGTGNLTATGTVQLKGVNTFSGKTVITGGFFCFRADSAFGAVPASATADSITLSGGASMSTYITSTAFTLNANRGIVLTTGNTGDWDIAANLTVPGVISGGGTLRKANNNGGTLFLTNTGGNTYSGGTLVNNGILSVGTGGTGSDTSSVNALGTGSVAINNNGTKIGTLRLWIQNSKSFSIPNNFTMNGGRLLNEDGIYTLPGTITLGANGGTLAANWAGKTLTSTGVISGSGVLTIAQGPSVASGGEITLSGTNTYTAGTILAGPTLKVTNTSALGTGAVTVTANSTINATANFSNNIAINTGIKLGFGGGFSTISGVISGPGSIATSNNGVIQGVNTYTGGTAISGGFLCINNDAALGAVPASFSASNISMSAGGSLSTFPVAAGTNVSLNANRGITLAAGLTGGFDPINGTTLAINGVISGPGGVRHASNSTTGILGLNGLNTYTGKTVLSRNITEITSIKNVGDITGSSLGNPADVSSGTIDLGSGSVATTTLRYVGTGSTTDRLLNLAGNTGGVTLTQSGTGQLTFTSGVTASGVGSKVLTLSGSTAGAGEISGPISDNATIGTTGLASTFALGATSVSLNSVAGIAIDATISGTGIAPGTTIIGINPASRIVILSTPTTAASGAVNSNYTIDGVTNPTAVTKSGTGTWALSGTHSYTGATTVNDGTLAITGTVASPITVNSAGKLAPGTGIGSFTAPGVTLYSGGTLAVQIDSTTGTADKVIVSSYAETFDATLSLSEIGSGSLAVGTKLTLIDYAGGTFSGTFNGLPEGASLHTGSNSFILSYDDSSKVTLTVVPGGYSTWASANAGSQAANLDFDGDGVQNGVEYFMGQTGSTFTANPSLTNGKVTWPKDPSAAATYVVETSTDLSAWVTATTGVMDNGTTVEYTVPTGSPVRFARIKVTTP